MAYTGLQPTSSWEQDQYTPSGPPTYPAPTPEPFRQKPSATPASTSTPAPTGWQSPNVSSTQGWYRAKDRGNGFGDQSWWTTVDSAGTSPYQRWNRTGSWRTPTAPTTPSNSWKTPPAPQQLDPWTEAQKSADLQYAQRQRATNDAIALLQTEGQRAVQRSQGYAQQEMADQGLLSSSNAVDKGVQYGDKAYSPYQQQIGQANADLQAYGNQLGDQTALMYQDLARQGRQEQMQRDQFNEMVRQFGVEKALQWWDMASAKELGLEQLNPDYTPKWPTMPTGMVNSIYSTPGKGYGPTGDVTPEMMEPHRGHGPIGDAGDKFSMQKRSDLGTSGARLNLDQNSTQFAQTLAANKEQNAAQLALQAAAYGLTPNGAGGYVKDTGAVDDSAFKQALMSAAWQPLVDPKTGQPVIGADGKPIYQTPDVNALNALASGYGLDLKNYTGMLPEALARPLRTQRRAGGMAPTALKAQPPNAEVAAAAARDNNSVPGRPNGWIDMARQQEAGTWSPWNQNQGVLTALGQQLAAAAGEVGGNLQDTWNWLTHGPGQTPKYNFPNEHW